MIRAWLFLGLIVATMVAVAVAIVWGDPGTAVVAWGGWRLDAPAAWLAGAMVVLSLVVALLWELGGVLAAGPRRLARRRAAKRREKADEALTAGFAALATGDAAEAQRRAEAARQHHADAPLARLLQAQAADARGDTAAAEEAWAALAEAPATRAAAEAALARIAHRRTAPSTPIEAPPDESPPVISAGA